MGARLSRVALPLAALVALALLAGCSREDDSRVPVECREGPGSLRAALARAPGEVRLEGTTRISDCFARSPDSADVQTVGSSVLDVADGLAARARQAPDGPEATRLGYLTGAVEKGTSLTMGIHGEIVRKLETQLTGVDRSAPAFRRGHDAGREAG